MSNLPEVRPWHKPLRLADANRPRIPRQACQDEGESGHRPAQDPARELADLWASVLPGEPSEQSCG